MRITRKELKIRGKMIYIEPIGDVHLGNPAFNEEKLLERIDEIRRDDDRYWIGMGDYIDNIRPYRRGGIDSRWNYSVLEGIPFWLDEWDKFVEYVKPIKDKCLGMLWGNHEWVNMEEREFERIVEKDLGVEFLGARAFILLDIDGKGVKKREWIIFAVHGDFSGDTSGGALNRVKSIARTHYADIYLYGHTHFKNADKGMRATVTKNGKKLEIAKIPVLYALTGCFLDPFYVGSDLYYDKKVRGQDVRFGTITIGIDPFQVKLYAFE
ncbi:MAG: metallophosphoesterase [Desulfurococcaceae archaeon]